MSRFDELINKYCANMDRQKDLDNSLLCEASREEWIGKLRDRSAEYEEINQEDNSIIRELLDLVNEPLTEEQAREYQAVIAEKFRAGYDETEILIPVLNRLSGLIKKKEVLITVHSELYFEENVVKANALNAPYVDTSHLEAIIDSYKDYTSFPELTRIAMWNNYFNYSIAALEDNTANPDLSCERFKAMLAEWGRPDIQALDGENQKIKDAIEGIKQEWLAIQAYMDTANDETCAFFCEMADHYFESECAGLEDPMDYNNEVYAAYLTSCYIKGERTLEDVTTEYFKYYEKRLQNYEKVHQEDNEIEKFYFATNAPMTLEYACRFLEDETLKKRILRTLINDTKKTWYSHNLNGFDPLIDGMLRTWCFQMLKYMNLQSEKIDWIIELVVRRQLITYLHSAMVRDLAEAISRELMRQQPDYFDCIPENYNSMDFIKNAALLHDIGKTSITTVITTQGRMLSDDEFMAIKNHPAFGYKLLEEDEDLKWYADIAKGHHKFYDGKGGYPADFDNTSSALKPIIDVITICDCLDAATDHLGRNYKKAKSFNQVLEEFETGKGTKYSPVVVDLIANSPRLRREIEYIVEEGRVDTMYKAYLQNAI